MAIKATFSADFTSFRAAVAQAEVQLKSFETGASKVTSALTRMTDSLSGRKVIQEATLMAEAIERIGGPSKLSAAELQRVGDKAREAVDKLKALGTDVPPNLQRLADGIKKTGDASSAFVGTLKQLAVGLGAVFTARAALNFVGNTIQEASALKDLSQQTHINVEELQLLSGAMSEFGVDADALGKALFTLSRQIAHGDNSVADALATMGLRLKDVQGLQGEQLFLSMERGLATLQGGLRDDTAAQLFGSRLGAAMAGASEGIDDAIAKWREHNKVVSSENIDALDKYDEAIKRTKKNLESLVTENITGPAAEGFNALMDAVERGVPKWDIFLAMLKDFASTSTMFGASTSALAKVLAPPPDVRQFLVSAGDAANATRKVTQSTKEHTQAVKEAKEAHDRYIETLNVAIRFFAQEQYQLALLESRNPLAGVGQVQVPGGQVSGRDFGFGPGAARATLPRFDAKANEAELAANEEVGRVLARRGQEGFNASWDRYLRTEFGATIVAAAAGGGNTWRAIGASIGQQIGQSLSNALANTLSRAFGSLLGGFLGSLLPGLGTVFGTFIGGLIGGEVGGSSGGGAPSIAPTPNLPAPQILNPAPGRVVNNITVVSWDSEDVRQRGVPAIVDALRGGAGLTDMRFLITGATA